MKTCDACGKQIDQYGTNFVKIQNIQNGVSQGYPSEWVRSTWDCCPGCVLGILKRVLIGHPETGEISDNQEANFQGYMKTDQDLEGKSK